MIYIYSIIYISYIYVINIIYIYICTYPKSPSTKFKQIVYNHQKHAKNKTTCATRFEFPYARAASMEGKPVFAPQVCTCENSVLSNAKKDGQWNIRGYQWLVGFIYLYMKLR